MTKTDIEKLYEVEPELTTNGIGGYKTEKLSEDHFPEIIMCMDWLRHQSFYKKMYKSYSSYYLKSIVEAKNRAYVSNGSFIAAAILLGLNYKKYQDDINIYLAIRNI